MIDVSAEEYSLKYTKTNELAKKECKKIEKVRSRLYSLGLIGSHNDGISFGNISLRYKKKNSFLITAAHTGEFPRLSPSYYSLVKRVNFKKFTSYAIGPSKPSIEAITHASIYTIDSNINAVIHVHNEKLWRYMLENDYLSTNDITYETPEILENIKSLYKNIDPFLNNAFVIKGHYEGIITFGKTLGEAEKSLYSILNKLIK